MKTRTRERIPRGSWWKKVSLEECIIWCLGNPGKVASVLGDYNIRMNGTGFWWTAETGFRYGDGPAGEVFIDKTKRFFIPITKEQYKELCDRAIEELAG